MTEERRETCEIPNCRTMFMGYDTAGNAHHACGKIAIFVEDRHGDLRGICAEHYARGIAAAGRASNQDLRGPDGRLDADKVRAFRDMLPEPEPRTARLLRASA